MPFTDFDDASEFSAASGEEQEQPLTVGQLTAQIKGTMEQAFPSAWVTGEISNFSRPSSGHCYFTLKDSDAQIRAVIWRGSANQLKFDLKDGLEIVCKGRIDVYAPRGSYQLVISQAQPQGVGALELALRQLKEKLAAEGLFDPARKQRLPSFPKRIAFVTSPTGAAVRDFLEVARRRWRGTDVLILPVRVQGDGASAEIAKAIAQANQLAAPPDVLVIGRGGGSIEDLWAFNEEPVIRALAASKIPTISAVGHEIDVTLSDLAADVRALTPSEAAELAVPSAEGMEATLEAFDTRMRRVVQRRIELGRQRLEQLARRRPLARPFAELEEYARRLDEIDSRLLRNLRGLVQTQRQKITSLAGKLDSLSPLGVLGRGYALVQDAKHGRVIRSVKEVSPGDSLTIRLTDGKLSAVAEATD